MQLSLILFVLLGRSRNLIIRELQRTNLDVNLAVNNLLSRDEEDGDDADDAQDSYVPEVSLFGKSFLQRENYVTFLGNAWVTLCKFILF